MRQQGQFSIVADLAALGADQTANKAALVQALRHLGRTLKTSSMYENAARFLSSAYGAAACTAAALFVTASCQFGPSLQTIFCNTENCPHCRTPLTYIFLSA